MALNDIEFVGNDRYFKYRYANETTINCSIPYDWEKWDFGEELKFMKEYLKRFLNIKLDFKVYSYNDLYNADDMINFFKKSHVIAQKPSSSFFHTILDHLYPSPPVGINKLIIVSSPKVTVTSNSWSFLNMDNEVVILIILTLILLALLFVIHSIVTNKYKSVPNRKVVRKIAQEGFETFWENASLLCAEPVPAVLPHITCRLLASSWLIGVTFILFFLGCYLRTNFSTESYNCIDTLSDLIKSGIKPTFLSENDIEYIKDWAARDPVAKKWLDAFDEEKLLVEYHGSTTVIDSLRVILSGEKVLIINADVMISIFGFLLKDPKTDKELIVRKGGLYFSQQALKFDYKHYIFNTSWIRSIPQLNAQLMVEPFFEKQILKYQELALYYSIEQFMWMRPLKSTEALDLSSVSVPFYFLLMLLSGTVAVVITEIIFK